MLCARVWLCFNRIPKRTRYDCGGGYLATCANMDMVLCGDSLGMVVCGQDGTVGVTYVLAVVVDLATCLSRVFIWFSQCYTACNSMDAMVHHCAATAKGIQAAASNNAGRPPLLVGDLPFGSYLNPDNATLNAVRLLKEGGAGWSMRLKLKPRGLIVSAILISKQSLFWWCQMR